MLFLSWEPKYKNRKRFESVQKQPFGCKLFPNSTQNNLLFAKRFQKQSVGVNMTEKVHCLIFSRPKYLRKMQNHLVKLILKTNSSHGHKLDEKQSQPKHCTNIEHCMQKPTTPSYRYSMGTIRSHFPPKKIMSQELASIFIYTVGTAPFQCCMLKTT